MNVLVVIDLSPNTFLRLNRSVFFGFSSSTSQTKTFSFIESKYILIFPLEVIIQSRSRKPMQIPDWGKADISTVFQIYGHTRTLAIQGVVYRPAESASPGNLEMQTFGPQARPA